MQRHDIRLLVALAVFTIAAAVVSAFMPGDHARVLRDATVPMPVVTVQSDGRITLTGPEGLTLRFTVDGSEPDASSPRFLGPFDLETDPVRVARMISTPTSVQWRHPKGNLPVAAVLMACCCTADGLCGPPMLHTSDPTGAVDLPMISIVMAEDDLLDQEHGIYVPGLAVFDQGDLAMERYQRDQSWWKYPGNFHYRGHGWEREAHMQAWSSAGGSASWSGPARLRINGNTTRGFPQHALRVEFDSPVRFPGLGPRPRRQVVLRAAGNDQDRAFMRDAVQHRMCASMPFATSGSVQVVVFINGAYWGIHHVRERLEDDELALRHDLRKKDITILADRALLYRGDESQRREFLKLVRQAERADPNAVGYLEGIRSQLDVDGFLAYMSAQMILGNTDWPDQNVKYWKYTGPPAPTQAATGAESASNVKDGRWRFIMGDSDMGLGGNRWSDYDMFAHVAAKHGPVARLFNALMRSAAVQASFRGTMNGQLQGPLSSEAMIAHVEAMTSTLEKEMPRHIDRWRRPLSMYIWRSHVEDLRTFARERGAHVQSQLDLHFPPAR